MKGEYRHYSFDLWLTLIKSNPEFKTERARFFYNNFNEKKKRIEGIQLIFRQVDVMCNQINETTGKNIDAEEMYLMVISMINDYEYSFSEINLSALYDEVEDILLNHMPVVYCDNTIDVLCRLKEKNGRTFNILSNTAFIKGCTLRKVLANLGLAQLFDFQLYSDEAGVSKPNRQFFQMMFEKVKNMAQNTDISLGEIVHVGDNPIADIAGASSFGINSILINSNNTNILNLLS